MPDPALVARVDALERGRFKGDGFRNHGPGYEPLGAGGSKIHGGRWNPPESFPVLYVALSLETAVAEFYRTAEGQGRQPSDFLPRLMTIVDVELSRVLNLTDAEAVEDAGLDVEELLVADRSSSQAVGDAAHYLGFEAVRAPSATGVGEVLAIFWDKMLPDSKVVPTSTEEWSSLPRRP